MRLVLASLVLLVPTSALACFFDHEERSGMNKICYYRCLSGMRAITVGGLDFCPMSIDD